MSFNDRIETLFEEYEQQRSSLAAMQARMREISATATSPRRDCRPPVFSRLFGASSPAVSVTVGQNGVLTDVKFPTGAHKRLPPTDVTDLIMATYAEAKENVLGQAAAILAPMLPAGLDATSLVRGTASADAFMPAEPRLATSVREMLGMGQGKQ